MVKKYKLTKRLKISYRKRRNRVTYLLARCLGRDVVESDPAEVYRWWARVKAVLFCVLALALHVWSWWQDTLLEIPDWTARSGAILVLAAAYLELSTINADDKLSIARRIQNRVSRYFGRTPPRINGRETDKLYSDLYRVAQESDANSLNDEYLRRRRLAISRWAMLLGGYGTVMWAYGDRIVIWFR